MVASPDMQRGRGVQYVVQVHVTFSRHQNNIELKEGGYRLIAGEANDVECGKVFTAEFECEQ